MNETSTLLRRAARRFAPVMGLVMLWGVVTTALHQHSDSLTHRSCVVCIAGHAPAVASIAIAPASVPVRHVVRLGFTAVDVHPQIDRATTSSRAPPAA